MTRKEIWYWMSGLSSWGNRTIHRLLEEMGSPEAIFAAKKLPISQMQQEEAEQKKKEMGKFMEESAGWERQGIRFLTVEEEEFPARLREIPDSPYFLFLKGTLPPPGPAVAVVGARKCTAYGRAQAEFFGRFLAEQGVSVISGMALGVDASAQKGARRAGGYTCAVLGTGVDVCYPACHRQLYEELSICGGILSEYPMGARPLPYHFPLRNRIISGLSDLVLVVEARKKSGSLITADWALEQGKDVLAIPGRLAELSSEGCNRLIRQGAGIVTEPEDVLQALGLETGTKDQKKGVELPPDEKEVWDCLSFEPKHLEQICQETGWEIRAILLILLRLELKGIIRQVGGNQYRRV
ncbi:DNA-processing protein DprA [Hominifimenecus sp. rT4P-3]|uniref:DNA-processing protein DprA n=1 Tax=Hominifimenecus sp. rT4P-3 TaxID=3242979 RepID=UPI003DA68757